MLHNNFERMSCVPALPGGNEEKHENLIQDRLHPGQEPKLELLNPLSPELNPICYFLALLGAHHFLHVSRIRVKLLTFRRQMSYIYGALILDVSRSHTTTQHSRQDSSGRVISSSQRPLPDNTQHSQQTNIPGGIRTHDLSRRAAAELRLRPRGYWDRQTIYNKKYINSKDKEFGIFFKSISTITFMRKSWRYDRHFTLKFRRLRFEKYLRLKVGLYSNKSTNQMHQIQDDARTYKT